MGKIYNIWGCRTNFFNLLFSLLICHHFSGYLFLFHKSFISILSFIGIPIEIYELRIFVMQLNEFNICEYLF